MIHDLGARQYLKHCPECQHYDQRVPYRHQSTRLARKYCVRSIERTLISFTLAPYSSVSGTSVPAGPRDQILRYSSAWLVIASAPTPTTMSPRRTRAMSAGASGDTRVVSA